MISSLLVFTLSAAGIILLARFGLYSPAQILARKAGLSPSATGQLLGYLTSAPELVATVFIAATGLFDVVAVNIVGSNIINVVLAGAAAVFYRQVRILVGKKYLIEQIIIVISILVPLVLIFTGQETSLWTVPLFILAYLSYLKVTKSLHVTPGPSEEVAQIVKPVKSRVIFAILSIIISIIGLYFLGNVLGDATKELGVVFAVPLVVLGIITAVVTSLPELTTFFSSFSYHKKAGTNGSSEVLHNLMASNVSNLLLIQTVGVVIFYLFA
jgi:Ca2+/Na+ antiporter